MRLALSFAAALALAPSFAVAQDAAAPAPSTLDMVVVVSRHGVRSPTSATEMLPYVAYPMASWEVPPGDLTPRGAEMIRNFGASYRAFYAAQGLLPATACPAADSIYVWDDIDERTKATGAALVDGLAPNCGIVAHDLGATVDPLFHALPALGKADPETARAAVAGSYGDDPAALVRANGLAFSKLDAILGCAASTCTKISSVPMTVKSSPKNGLAGTAGAVDLASTAVEDFILAYADGKPLDRIGNGAVDAKTLLELSTLHTLKFATNTEPPYIASAQGSNLLDHVIATIDQGASGTRNERTRAPLAARFVAFVGHDTNLEEFAGMLRLHWLLAGYQPNDTPPGGALVFEVRRAGATSVPFVRTFFEAQSLDQMRRLETGAPARVPVFVPGCPSLDCPLPTFDRIARAAIDPAFVGTW